MDGLCAAQQLIQVITKDLDAQVRAHAGNQLIKSQLDRLRDFVVVAHKFIQSLFHLLNEFALGQVRFRPLIARLEHHVTVGNIRWHRVGGDLRGAHPGKCHFNLRELADAFFHVGLKV